MVPIHLIRAGFPQSFDCLKKEKTLFAKYDKIKHNKMKYAYISMIKIFEEAS